MSVNYVSINALHSNLMKELLSACKAQPEDVEKACSQSQLMSELKLQAESARKKIRDYITQVKATSSAIDGWTPIGWKEVLSN